MTANSVAVTKAAVNLTAILEGNDGQLSTPGSVAEALSPLLVPPDSLYETGLERAKTRLARSRVIFFNTQLNFILSNVQEGYIERPHNHGVVNVVLVCAGEIQFQAYRRLDDQTRPGYAELEIATDEHLKRGDVGLIEPPPNDIHGFQVLTDEAWFVTAVLGRPNDLREYYDVSANSYTEDFNFDPTQLVGQR